MRISKGDNERHDVAYQWIMRPDGSIFRQLHPLCIRAIKQLRKGKGVNRVQIRG